MSDVTAKAVITIDAKTVDAVREMNKFADAQKAAAKATEATGTSVASLIKGAAEGFGKFNLAIGGVEKAFGLLKGAMDTAFEVNRRESMEKMLPTGAVDKLSAATDHLISRQDTLRLSVRGMTGDFKVTEAQMQKVLQAAVAFSQKGLGPAAEIADKLLDGIAGKTGKLDDLGIAFEKTGTAAGDAAELFGKMDAAINDPGNAVDARTKELAQLKDQMEQVTLAIDRMIAAGARGIAKAAGYASELGGYVGDVLGEGHDGENAITAQAARAARGQGFRPWEINTAKRKRESDAYWLAQSESSTYNGSFVDQFGTGVKPGGRGKAAEGRGIPVVIVGVETGGGKLGGITGLGDEGGVFGGTATDRFGNSVGAVGVANDNLSFGVGRGNLSALQGGERFFGSADLAGRGSDTIESRLGSSEALQGGFDALSTGINAAVMAAVDGSDAIGRAAAKASAAVLKSIAIESTGRAIYEGALALGSLAIGDGKGAALHGAAAAKYAIAAGVTGALAGTLGAIASSGQSSGGGASAPVGGGFGSATGGTSGGGTVSVTVNVGYGFSGDSKQIEEAVRRGVRAAQLKGGRSNYATEVAG